MKILIFMLALSFLPGCLSGADWTQVKVEDLKLKAGQEVRTDIRFYSDCEGTISGFHNVYDPAKGHVYKVSFWCPEIGRIEDVGINENSLKPL